jgi:hypothetical protein
MKVYVPCQRTQGSVRAHALPMLGSWAHRTGRQQGYMGEYVRQAVRWQGSGSQAGSQATWLVTHQAMSSNKVDQLRFSIRLQN